MLSPKSLPSALPTNHSDWLVVLVEEIVADLVDVYMRCLGYIFDLISFIFQCLLLLYCYMQLGCVWFHGFGGKRGRWDGVSFQMAFRPL